MIRSFSQGETHVLCLKILWGAKLLNAPRMGAMTTQFPLTRAPSAFSLSSGSVVLVHISKTAVFIGDHINLQSKKKTGLPPTLFAFA
jgi:hypothetical protein